MKFQVGDKVLVLHSEEEGEVVDIINNKMVMVDVRGVKFPAYTDQLDFPYFKRFSEQKLFPAKKQKTFIDEVKREKSGSAYKQVSDGVWLLFLPKFESDEFGDDVVESMKIHLINQTKYGLQFIYRLVHGGNHKFELINQVYSSQDFYLHDVSFEDLSDSPTFTFEFSLITPEKKKVSHFESSLKLKPKQLYNKVEELKKKGDASFSYQLFSDYPDQPVEMPMEFGSLAKAGYKVYAAEQARQHLEPAKQELDLHIEKLTGEWQYLDSFAKLGLQLQTFEKYLDLAMAHHLPSMIVIHGVGTGRLKEEVHEILKYRSGIKSFVNQYDPRYGYGATEIFFG